MDNILTDLSTSALVKAIKNNLYEFFRFLQRSPVTDFHEDSKLIRWRTPIPHPWFNAVLSTQPPAMGDEHLVDEIVAYFRSYERTAITWWLDPDLPLADWKTYLAPRGFHQDSTTPGMAVALATMREDINVAGELRIVPVEDRHMLKTWVHTFILGYELPLAWEQGFFDLMLGLGLDFPMRNYLGYLHNKPVATANGFYAAGVVGVQCIATVPEARRRGIGAALTLASLREAYRRGYHAGILQASAMGYKVYEQLGFQKLCDMDHFFWHNDTDQF